MAKPAWIDYSAFDGAKMVFQWRKEMRALYPDYRAEDFARFPDVVIAGAVYATPQEARDWADEPLGETAFFATWNEAIKWLVDPNGAYLPLGFPYGEVDDAG